MTTKARLDRLEKQRVDRACELAGLFLRRARSLLSADESEIVKSYWLPLVEGHGRPPAPDVLPLLARIRADDEARSRCRELCQLEPFFRLFLEPSP